MSTDPLLFDFVHAGCAHVSLASRTSQRLTNAAGYLTFVVSEEDHSDEEADSAGPVKWVVLAWEVATGSGQRGVKGRAEGTESERKWGASECASISSGVIFLMHSS
jgi:hypothetical protein